jgi:hypothetical protein
MRVGVQQYRNLVYQSSQRRSETDQKSITTHARLIRRQPVETPADFAAMDAAGNEAVKRPKSS